jgi:hypothetical protein
MFTFQYENNQRRASIWLNQTTKVYDLLLLGIGDLNCGILQCTFSAEKLAPAEYIAHTFVDDGFLRCCPTCNAPALYVAEMGAPGVGSAWECLNGHSIWSCGHSFIDFRELEPADIEMTPEEVL